MVAPVSAVLAVAVQISAVPPLELARCTRCQASPAPVIVVVCLVLEPSLLVKATRRRGPLVLNGAVVTVPVPFWVMVWSTATAGAVICRVAGWEVERTKVGEVGLNCAVSGCPPGASVFV